MLEIKNVKRIYTPKKGIPVTALDGISLKFADKGMVFLLGKSGSGKSTLLNVMGGLDKYDAGEIIIKGKSSIDFSQGDFDSYRNTYLGFIFQEYNILNEFTVGANIGLALELQGKKATDEAVNAILEEVDLVGYGQRKPSELSGGQKQRVAIARALVKSPEIIMADEPTGALDSNTGLQVFDTLKKLSRDKLVIVVTHDREFAELYGDRVIELKDGKIISDIEKFKAESHKKNDSISIIDNKIIQIKKGYKLTQEDLKFINEYIAEQDAILSIDKKTNADMKKFARIDIDGNREAFKDTDESKIISSEDKKFKLIKSKLPFKNSFKIGASSLKNKPFRLFVTILLSMVAFAMFGLADTMGSYNKYTTTRTSFVDSQIDSFTLQKIVSIYNERYKYTSINNVNSSDADITLLKEKTGLDFDRIYLPNKVGGYNFSSSLDESIAGISPYTCTFSGFFEASKAKVEELGFSYKGTMPTKFTEIAISKYAYSHFEKYGYKYLTTTKKASEITSENVFLDFNPKIKINDVVYDITAIVDTDFDFGHFESLGQANANNLVSYMQLTELNDTVNYGYHGLVFVAEGYINKQIEEVGETPAGITLSNANFSISNQNNSNFNGPTGNYFAISPQILFNIKDANDSGYVQYLSGGRTSLAKNEIMLDALAYVNLIESALSYKIGYDELDIKTRTKQEAPNWYYEYKYGFMEEYEYVTDYLNTLLKQDIGYFDQLLLNLDWEQEDIGQTDINNIVANVYGYLATNPTDNTYCKSLEDIYAERELKFGDYDLTSYSKKVLTDAIISGDIMNTNNVLPSSFYANISNYLNGFEEEGIILTVVGFIYNEDTENNYSYVFVIDDTIYGNMNLGETGDYAYLIAKMPTDTSTLNKIIKFSYDYKENNISFAMKNGVMATLDMVNELIEMLAKVFLYIGLGFAVFAALMLMNYIATSISYKRREIGILRAVGARSSDVFGIFFNESLLIALINFVLATIATVVTVVVINSVLRTQYNLLLTILNFGIRQLLLMLVISVAVAFVASFLPVYKVARQRPIDAIKK